jgi:hypothetical protein
LGHFFNKVRRRKNYNIAICAVPRKLAILSWHLLTTGLPYRYAKPSSVEAKLAKLRCFGTCSKPRLFDLWRESVKRSHRPHRGLQTGDETTPDGGPERAHDGGTQVPDSTPSLEAANQA